MTAIPLAAKSENDLVDFLKARHTKQVAEL
jgi:hypothetical protein